MIHPDSALNINVSNMSIWLLSAAMKTIPVGTAYAVWTGIGAVGVAILGMILFGESREILRITCLFRLNRLRFTTKLIVT